MLESCSVCPRHPPGPVRNLGGARPNVVPRQSTAQNHLDNVLCPAIRGGITICPRRACSCASKSQSDIFDLEVLLDALRTPFATDPGCLDTAERSGRIGNDSLIQSDHPGLEPLRKPDGT